jgi:translation initiation factor IF-3
MTVRPPQKKDVVLANDKIKFDRVQLINHLGENQGVVSRREALQAAQDAGLDLVLIAEQGGEGVPVVKVIDMGKMQYEKKKQQMEARKKQHVIQVKELKIRPKIAEHDYLTKMRQGATFLQEGKHLKITLVFRGREATMKSEQGPAFFARVDATLGAVDFAGKSVAIESDAQTDNLWSRVYILKK